MDEGARSDSKPLSADLIRRLALVRYLHDVAVDQSRRPEPFAGFALLPLHDTVEMFLQIVAEHRGAPSAKRSDFMIYWTILKEVGVNLPYEKAMERLNAARVNLKHRGVLPARSEIEGFRTTVTALLEDSASSALFIDFNRISLTTLVRSEAVKQPLEAAEKALAESDFTTALGESAKAFVCTLREHILRPRADRGHWRGYNLYEAFSPSSLAYLDYRDDVNRLAHAVGEAGRKLAEAIIVVGFNLDFEAYLLFKSHAPVVQELAGGNLVVEWTIEPTSNPGIARRCVNFVVDTTIRLEATVY